MKMMADHGVAESFDGIGGLIGPTDSEDDDDDEHDRHPCARRPPLSSLGESPLASTSSPTSLRELNSSVLRLEDITILKSRHLAHRIISRLPLVEGPRRGPQPRDHAG